MDVVWQRLVLRREVGSSVFQEPPFHSILIFLLLPPGEKQDHERVKTYFGRAIFHWFHVWLCAWLDAAKMGLGSMEDEKNGVFQTISNEFAPPPLSFWSSVVLPLQSPPLFSWAFCCRYCLLPSSPSVQIITVKIISYCVILIYIHSLSKITSIIAYFLKTMVVYLLCRLIWFLCLPFSVTIFFLFMLIFFLCAADTKQILQYKKKGSTAKCKVAINRQIITTF